MYNKIQKISIQLKVATPNYAKIQVKLKNINGKILTNHPNPEIATLYEELRRVYNNTESLIPVFPLLN